MLNTFEAYQKGLEDGRMIALDMLNSALNINAENLGAAVAHVHILQNQFERAKKELHTDWK